MPESFKETLANLFTGKFGETARESNTKCLDSTERIPGIFYIMYQLNIVYWLVVYLSIYKYIKGSGSKIYSIIYILYIFPWFNEVKYTVGNIIIVGDFWLLWLLWTWHFLYWYIFPLLDSKWRQKCSWIFRIERIF